jgi:hypothetical protein
MGLLNHSAGVHVILGDKATSCRGRLLKLPFCVVLNSGGGAAAGLLHPLSRSTGKYGDSHEHSVRNVPYLSV